MFQQYSAQRTLLAAVVGISSFVSVAARADGDQPRAANFVAVMAAKDPAHFGPHLPAADLPSTYRAPVPGSIAAIAAAKDPSHFGPYLAAANVPSSYLAPATGSIAALLAVKDPSRFGPHPAAGDSASGDAPPAPGSLAAGDGGSSGRRGCDTAC
ncbi:MAG: hypothetical protein JWR07_1998 [Nevskia sp.]|nr:hypothetical protein [Nevskia sp.]